MEYEKEIDQDYQELSKQKLFSFKFSHDCYSSKVQLVRMKAYLGIYNSSVQADIDEMFKVDENMTIEQLRKLWYQKNISNQIVKYLKQNQYVLRVDQIFYPTQQKTILSIKRILGIQNFNQTILIFVFPLQFSPAIQQSQVNYQNYEQKNCEKVQTAIRVQNTTNEETYFYLQTPRRTKIPYFKNLLEKYLLNKSSIVKLQQNFQYQLKIRRDCMDEDQFQRIQEELKRYQLEVQNGMIDFTKLDKLYLREICPPGEIVYLKLLSNSNPIISNQPQFMPNPIIKIQCIKQVQNQNQTHFENLIISNLYKNIRNLKVCTILQQHRAYDPMFTSIYFNGLTLKPHQKLTKFDQLIQRNNSRIQYFHIIPENFLFYKDLLSFEEKKHEQLLKKLIKNHIYSNRRSSDFRQKVSKRIEKIQNYNRQIQNDNIISTLLLYTGPFFYSEFNSFLRQNSLSLVLKYDFNEDTWQYPFCEKLIKSLLKLPNYQGKVYRGSKGYKYKYSEGSVIEWNGFTSTTNKYDIALNFVTSMAVYPYIFQIETFTGKYIADYSFYRSESQIIILPYTKFQVVEIIQKIIDKQLINFIKLRELPIPKKIPGHLIIWIDPNFAENIRTYNKIVKQNHLPQFDLIQLASNDHFLIWLRQFSTIFSLRELNITVFSNMNRPPDYKMEGIETCRLVQNLKRQIKIVYYINSAENTIKSLQQAGINVNDKRIFIASNYETLKHIVVNKLRH